MLTREEIAKYEMSPVIQLCYDYILPISDNRILATHGSNISLITRDGIVLCTYDSIYAPIYPGKTFWDVEESIYKYEEEFMDGLLICVDSGKKGIIDYDGDIIVEAKYREITFNADKEAEVLP